MPAIENKILERQIVMREDLQIQVINAKAHSEKTNTPTGKLTLANNRIEIKASKTAGNSKVASRQAEIKSKKSKLNSMLMQHFEECSREHDSGSIFIKAITAIYVDRLKQELAKKPINLEVVDYVLSTWQRAQKLELMDQERQQVGANAQKSNPEAQITPPPSSNIPSVVPNTQDAKVQPTAPAGLSVEELPPPSDTPPTPPSIRGTNRQKNIPDRSQAPSYLPPPLPPSIHKNANTRQDATVQKPDEGPPPPSDEPPTPPTIRNANTQPITSLSTQPQRSTAEASNATPKNAGSSLAQAFGYTNNQWAYQDYEDYYAGKLDKDNEFFQFMSSVKKTLNSDIERLEEEQKKRNIANGSGAAVSSQHGPNAQGNAQRIDPLTKNPATAAAREQAEALRYSSQLIHATKLVKISSKPKTSHFVQIAMNGLLKESMHSARRAGLTGSNPLADAATSHYLGQIQQELSKEEKHIERIREIAKNWKTAVDYAVTPEKKQNPTQEVLSALSFLAAGDDKAVLLKTEFAGKAGKAIETGTTLPEEKLRKRLLRPPTARMTMGQLQATFN